MPASTHLSPVKPGDRLPPIRLLGTEGRPLSLAAFRQRRNLVIVLLGGQLSPREEAFLRALVQEEPAIRGETAELLLVTTAPPEGAQALSHRLGRPLWTDPKAALHRALLGGETPDTGLGVLVVDRYGEIYAVHRPGDGPPRVEEILEWLRFIELQCPE